MRLVLASGSPRRAELLRAAGFTFDVRPVDLDERVREGEAPDAYVKRLAAGKASLGRDRYGADDIVVLGADTAVVVEGRILGKPADDEDARRMLERLSGRAHEVLTAVSVKSATRQVTSTAVTRVWFAPLTSDEIAWYVRTGEGKDKAGGYAIQGVAARFVPRIEGSYSNVVGLPVALVHEILRAVASPR
jgi:septum formation protein